MNNEDAEGKYIGVGVILLGVVIVWGIASTVSHSQGNKNMRDKVRKIVSRSDLRIAVDGKLLDTVKTKEMATALMTIANKDAHHSHPMDISSIQLIVVKDTMVLRIGQDSYDSTEYWIYSDKNESTEIGRIWTKTSSK